MPNGLGDLRPLTQRANLDLRGGIGDLGHQRHHLAVGEAQRRGAKLAVRASSRVRWGVLLAQPRGEARCGEVGGFQ